MKIFVTGSTGFIGQHLVPLLLEQGHTVRCLARARSQKPDTFLHRVDWITGDIQDPDSLKKAMKNIDVVIHMAGIIKSTRSELYYHVNVGGCKNLLDALRERGKPYPQFIFISSQAAVGPGLELSPPTEDSPAKPVSDYGRSKLAAEELVKNSEDLNYTIIRPSVVYGPGDRESLKLFSIARLHLNPQIGFNRSYISLIHVSDLVHLIGLCITNPNAHCQIFHASDENDRGYSTRDIIRLSAIYQKTWTIPVFIPKYLLKIAAGINNYLSIIMGTVPILNPDKFKELTARGWIISSRKARERLGFQPKYDLQNGLKMTINWYRENGWL